MPTDTTPTPTQPAPQPTEPLNPEAAATVQPTTPPAQPTEPKPDENALGDAGKKALRAERDRAADLERQLNAERRKREALEAEKLSDQEKLELRAKQGDERLAQAQQKLRRGNLIVALAEKGITGAASKAAIRLIDGVEYDDDDEPTNLDTALEAAKAQYGEGFFKGATPASGSPTPDLHQGPRTAGPMDEEKAWDEYVKRHFPTSVSATP